MVRCKTQMKRIENATSRQVTFSKRRNGLLKKAYELSVLCDAEVALIVFSPRGKVYEFASPSMQMVLDKYEKYSQESGISNMTKEKNSQHLKGEIAQMEERVNILESTQRKMLGEDLASCSMKELNQLESQTERGLNRIRARKTEILMDQREQLKRKERMLTEENVFLRKMCAGSQDGSDLTAPVNHLERIRMEHSEVETQLVMRPPHGMARENKDMKQIDSSD